VALGFILSALFPVDNLFVRGAQGVRRAWEADATQRKPWRDSAKVVAANRASSALARTAQATENALSRLRGSLPVTSDPNAPSRNSSGPWVVLLGAGPTPDSAAVGVGSWVRVTNGRELQLRRVPGDGPEWYQYFLGPYASKSEAERRGRALSPQNYFVVPFDN
jgi:hypothetical protein